MRVTISLPEEIHRELERAARRQGNRSRVVQAALERYFREVRRANLEDEARKLSRSEEVSLAEEAIEVESEEWPEF